MEQCSRNTARPAVECLEDRSAALAAECPARQIAGSVNNRRHPAKRGRPTDGFRRLGREPRRVRRYRNADMGVGLDAARHHDFSARVNDPPALAAERSRLTTDGNCFALNADVDDSDRCE